MRAGLLISSFIAAAGSAWHVHDTFPGHLVTSFGRGTIRFLPDGRERIITVFKEKVGPALVIERRHVLGYNT